jgi:hypothetical protein
MLRSVWGWLNGSERRVGQTPSQLIDRTSCSAQKTSLVSGLLKEPEIAGARPDAPGRRDREPNRTLASGFDVRNSTIHGASLRAGHFVIPDSDLGNFWGNGSFNMTSLQQCSPHKGAEMNMKRFATKVASTAVVVLIPLTALAPSALAAPRHTAHTAGGVSTATRGSAPNAWASRTSALPDGGAALFDGIPLDGGSAFYHVPAAPAPVNRVAPNAWSSRASGLEFGGAALYV